MAICMNVPASRLLVDGRSDPEYFLPQHTAVASKLDALPTLPLRKIARLSCSAFYPAATHLYANDGIPFLRCVDAVDFPILAPDQPFARIPATFASAHGTIRTLEAGDIVITKVGTPCYASLLSDDMPPSAMTRTVLGASGVDREVVDPYYLVAFLRSRYGFDQLMRERELTIQYQLTLERTRKIRIVVPDRTVQKTVGNMMRDYFRALRQSVDRFSSARALLETELGLGKVSFKKPLGHATTFSATMQAGRIDADYFQPEYESIRSLIATYRGGYEPLLGCCDALRPNVDPSRTPNASFEYIELSNIDTSVGLVEGALSGTGAMLPTRARRQVKAGDVIASSVVGSIDKAAAILDGQDGHIASTGFFHLRPKMVSTEYLLLLVRSPCVRMQFQQQSTGGILSAVPDRRLKRVIIPRIPAALQHEITDLVACAHAAKRKSHELLEQAKRRVEEMIERAVHQ